MVNKALVEKPTTLQSGATVAVKLKALVGSGEKIGIFTLPFLAIGLALNMAFPTYFSVGGPSRLLGLISFSKPRCYSLARPNAERAFSILGGRSISRMTGLKARLEVVMK